LAVLEIVVEGAAIVADVYLGIDETNKDARTQTGGRGVCRLVKIVEREERRVGGR